MTHGKTYNKSPRRINHKATKSKTNTGTTALERSVEQTINPLINAGAREMTKFFSKNSHSYLDFEPSNLKVELAGGIIIPNIYMNIY